MWEKRNIYRLVAFFSLCACLKLQIDHTTKDNPTKPHFKHILIFARARTGSTFTLDIIADDKKTFKVFEPVNLARNFLRKNTTETAEFLKDIFHCRASKYPIYLQQRVTSGFRLADWRFNETCFSRIPSYCDLFPEEIEDVMCESYPVRVIKTIYLERDVLPLLLSDPGLDLAVIYLVRDPRGTLSSRREMEKVMGRMQFDHNASSHCTEREKDYSSYVSLEEQYPGRLLLVKYEDLAINPYETSKRIYKFLGLPFTRRTEKMLFEHSTQLSPKQRFNLYGSYRNSATRPDRWKTELSWEAIDQIQKSCSNFLEKMNYQIYGNAEELKQNYS